MLPRTNLNRAKTSAARHPVACSLPPRPTLSLSRRAQAEGPLHVVLFLTRRAQTLCAQACSITGNDRGYGTGIGLGAVAFAPAPHPRDMCWQNVRASLLKGVGGPLRGRRFFCREPPEPAD